MNEPTVEIWLYSAQLPTLSYSYTRRGMPSRPITCWIRKVDEKPKNISQKLSLPRPSSASAR